MSWCLLGTEGRDGQMGQKVVLRRDPWDVPWFPICLLRTERMWWTDWMQCYVEGHLWTSLDGTCVIGDWGMGWTDGNTVLCWGTLWDISWCLMVSLGVWGMRWTGRAVTKSLLHKTKRMSHFPHFPHGQSMAMLDIRAHRLRVCSLHLWCCVLTRML